jgi:methylase of polypeptide subunit release factors
MASLFNAISKEKENGEVFTPLFIVEKMLNDIDFNNKIGCSVLEPSCGDGAFLVEVVKRIISFSKKEELENNLKKVQGWDIQQKNVNKCIENLNKIFKFDWNIKCVDSLFYETTEKFDLIIGNPPYIKVQNLNIDLRNCLQNKYKFCTGNTDIYFAFFELCDNLLSEKGECSLITPNGFINNKSGKTLRNFFYKNKYLKRITNYNSLMVFENISVYAAITYFTKKENNVFEYQYANSLNDFTIIEFPVKKLKEEIWDFRSEPKNIGKKLKDICTISTGLATLCDNIFIFDDLDIEKELVFPIVKASTKQVRKILFPYENGEIIDEEKLAELYPKAYSYLLSNKDLLLKRDNGTPNSIAWYAFGRSQGIKTSFGKKILFSPINLHPNFFLSEDENTTFYSGYALKYNGDYNWILSKLNSKEFEDYINSVGKDFRGGWKGYTKRIVDNFLIENVS